jgi:hypothetical protein
MRLRLVFLVLAVLAAGACAEGGAPAAQQTPDLAGPLQALPPCEAPPEGIDEVVKGLIAPEGIIVTDVRVQKPLTNVSAYIEQTPIQFEAMYTKMEDITILSSENEIFEAEMLISDGKYRNFLKAAAMCDQGSQLLIVIAPEIAAETLPTPAGTPTPPKGQMAPATPTPGG